MKLYRKFGLLLLILVFLLCGCNELGFFTENSNIDGPKAVFEAQKVEETIEEDGSYTSPESVSAYLKTFHKLPSNYITKNEAVKLGWDNKKGNLWEVTDQKSIGGDRFLNREKKLPQKDGRIWYECDINYKGGYRGEERIVYSNDGLIYYTEDHYETFDLLVDSTDSFSNEE